MASKLRTDPATGNEKTAPGSSTRRQNAKSIDNEILLDVWEKDDTVQEEADEIAPIYKLNKNLDDEEWLEFITDKRKTKNITQPYAADDHELAPLTLGAYYVWADVDDFKQNEDFVLCGEDRKPKFKGFIPIAFLIALGRNDVDWTSIQKLRKDRGTQIKPDEYEHDADEEKKFIESWKNAWLLPPPQWKPPSEYNKVPCWVPVRGGDGNLSFHVNSSYPHSYSCFNTRKEVVEYKLRWRDVLERIWKRRSSPHTGRPPRWARVPLTNGLRVCLNPGCGQIDEQFLKDCADQINGSKEVEYKKLIQDIDLAKKNPKMKNSALLFMMEERLKEKWKVDAVKPPTESTDLDWEKWILISSSPFDHYSSYIHQDDWNAYMKTLAKDVDIPQNLKAVSQDPNYAQLVERARCENVCRPPVFATTSETLKTVDKKYEAFAKAAIAAKKLQESGLEPTPEDVKKCFSHIRKISKTPDANNYRYLYETINLHWLELDVGSRFSSSLNYGKVKSAAGKRKTEHDQNAVMGESASVLANEIGWSHDDCNAKNQKNSEPEADDSEEEIDTTSKKKEEPLLHAATSVQKDETMELEAEIPNQSSLQRYMGQMSNYLYIGEWLHLRAFSWGGHLDLSTYHSVTSQIPFNLVFGTSETNSVMLRYEKAWQNLFGFEQKIQSKIDSKAIVNGKLWIHTNPTKPSNLAIPKLSTDDLSLISAPQWGQLDVVEQDFYDEDADRFIVKEIRLSKLDGEAGDMRAISKKHPYIAYSIAYYMNMQGKSWALGRDDPSRFLKFFPFRRPFFHRAESILDDLLFIKLRELGKQAAAGSLGDSAKDLKVKDLIMGKKPKKTTMTTLKKQPQSAGLPGNEGISGFPFRSKDNASDIVEEPVDNQRTRRIKDTQHLKRTHSSRTDREERKMMPQYQPQSQSDELKFKQIKKIPKAESEIEEEKPQPRNFHLPQTDVNTPEYQAYLQRVNQQKELEYQHAMQRKRNDEISDMVQKEYGRIQEEKKTHDDKAGVTESELPQRSNPLLRNVLQEPIMFSDLAKIMARKRLEDQQIRKNGHNERLDTIKSDDSDFD